MSNILAIETSFPAASIALKQGNATAESLSFESHRQQNQLLFPPLEQLLDSLPSDQSLDLILVGTGPGSYSGSRIAIAAAQGIAAIHSCEVIGISSFLGTADTLDTKDKIAVGDARRGSFYIATIPQGGLPQAPELWDRDTFDKKTSSTTAFVFSLEPKMQFHNGTAIPQQNSSAENLISSWNQLNAAQQKTLRNTPPSPTYLRAPFITKAKEGHPLLRGKVKST